MFPRSLRFYFSISLFILTILIFSCTDQKPVLSGEEQERKITTYEGAMMKIKDATGVSDIRVS